jgi:hypothetical protein
MPIYGRGLYYGSPTGTWKDAYIVPERKWRSFGQVEDSGGGGDESTVGKTVAVLSVLGSLAILLLTLRLGKAERV